MFPEYYKQIKFVLQRLLKCHGEELCDEAISKMGLPRLHAGVRDKPRLYEILFVARELVSRSYSGSSGVYPHLILAMT